jgi:hypothetical protein
MPFFGLASPAGVVAATQDGCEARIPPECRDRACTIRPLKGNSYTKLHQALMLFGNFRDGKAANGRQSDRSRRGVFR